MAEAGSEVDGCDNHSPTASISSGENTVWADVSPLLIAACKDLQDGELIHGENFSLFAAMSALEVLTMVDIILLMRPLRMVLLQCL